jgi:hypothetical protein
LATKFHPAWMTAALNASSVASSTGCQFEGATGGVAARGGFTQRRPNR